MRQVLSNLLRHGAAKNAGAGKIFGIGANKTGTTSLNEALRLLGLHVAPQEKTELCAADAYRGDLRPLIRVVRRYQAFQDIPFSTRSVYAQLDALFPGSKFILTVRDPDDWFRSLTSFMAQQLGVADVRDITESALRAFSYRYPGYLANNAAANWLLRVGNDLTVTKDWRLLYDKEHYVRIYQRRNEEIVRHFSERPDDLLVLDIARETDTKKIADFLGVPTRLVTAMPRLNVT